ncbi:conserved hypothetical protein [Culex quinquefasciatus]|uniref:Uncharacterized protein n=1 Tax=Culex quinquefasciatus TaxID=7176 RepID=B0W687_CULQU|nr:conserved hypothetical protein [Culex quinquefasciatus]|eukprot:XP_001844221.1 conserved hypothetical protein [Culex quinquefasciatus]
MSNKQGYEISQDIVAPISIRASQHLDTVGDSSESQSVHQTRPQSQRSYAGRVLPPPEPGADPPFVPSRTTIASPLLPYISLPVICETFKFRLQIPIVESDVLINAFEGMISQVISKLKEHLAGEIEFYKKQTAYAAVGFIRIPASCCTTVKRPRNISITSGSEKNDKRHKSSQIS